MGSDEKRFSASRHRQWINRIARKERGMVSTMADAHKRSRVFTMHAMWSEKVENSVAARTTMDQHVEERERAQFSFTLSSSERP